MLQLRLYIVKSTCRPLAIKTNPLKTCLQKQKYNATIGDRPQKPSPSKLYSKRTHYCVSSADELINWIDEPWVHDSSSSCDPGFSESLISSTSRVMKGFVYSKTVWTDLAEQWTVQQWATGQWKDLHLERCWYLWPLYSFYVLGSD